MDTSGMNTNPVMATKTTTEIKASEFLGLTKFGGQNLAEAKNMIFRLISIDTEPFMSYPDDVRTDRVCVEITNGRITKATIQ
jgi:hypothetical protein